MSTTNISGPESAVTDVEKGKVEVVATAATRFDQDVEIQIEKFEISQQKCDERLGVMLLLDYKKRLDEMNERYQSLMRHMVAPSGNLVTFEQEVYIKARDLYEDHLRRVSSRDPSIQEAAYHKILLATAARIHTQLLETQLLSRVPEDIMGLSETTKRSEKLNPVFAHDELQEDKRGIYAVGRWSPTSEAYRESFMVRSAIALMGGFALIIPMLIMKLGPTTFGVCLTATVFVTVVAQLLAGFVKELTSVLTLTAAYAAVLVVFVGNDTEDDEHPFTNAIDGAILGGFCSGIAILMLLLWWLSRRRKRALLAKYHERQNTS